MDDMRIVMISIYSPFYKIHKMEKVISIKDCIKNIQDFANEHEIVFTKEGECGFGRECVGLLKGENYINYNPTDSQNHDPIPGFEDSRFYDIAPPSAYHKHDCFAVLGRGDDSIRQLSDWVDDLKRLGAKLETYSTGATGIQAMITGRIGYAFKLTS